MKWFFIFTFLLFSQALSATPSIDLQLREVSLQELNNAVSHVIDSVPELHELKIKFEERGLRLWFMGGTASALAVFAKWDLLKRSGDTRFLDGRLDYELELIYHSLQDYDLVVGRIDGGSETLEDLVNAKQLAQEILGKENVEIRGLYQANVLRSGNSVPGILRDENLKKQNTDTHSIGLIEITSTKGKETEFRCSDIHGFKSKSAFCNDIAQGTLRFIESPAHTQTDRYKEGKNPEIIGAIRFLIKAVASGVRPDASSLKKIQRIIQSWNIHSKNPYVDGWIQKHAPKLLLMALDLEAAWNFIEEIGLRKKLIAFAPDSELALLLDKEPLRSSPSSFATPLRQKDRSFISFSSTATEMPREVSHATRNIEALESIRRHPFGKPNFFVSRWNKKGETAVDDEGLYTAHGQKGWGEYTLNTVMEVSAEARPILRDTRAIFQSSVGLRLRPFRSNKDPDYLIELLFNSSSSDLELERINKKFKRAVKYHTNTQELLNKWAARLGAWMFENPARVSLLQSWIAKNLKDIPLVKILETLKAIF